MDGLAALKAGIIIIVGLVAVVYGLAGQTELQAGFDGQQFCQVTWPNGDTWIWTRMGSEGTELPITVSGDGHSRCQVEDAAFDSGGLYYIAHRGDNKDEAIEDLNTSCQGDDAPCAYITRAGDVLVLAQNADRKASTTPVWADGSVTGLNPLYDLLGRPFTGLVALLAVFSFGTQAWRAWDS